MKGKIILILAFMLTFCIATNHHFNDSSTSIPFSKSLVQDTLVGEQELFCETSSQIFDLGKAIGLTFVARGFRADQVSFRNMGLSVLRYRHSGEAINISLKTQSLSSKLTLVTESISITVYFETIGMNVEIDLTNTSLLPIFRWDAGGNGSVFPNSSFQVVITSPNGSVFESGILQNVTSYTLNPSTWQNIKLLGGIGRVEVIGMDNNYYATGPFRSIRNVLYLDRFELTPSFLSLPTTYSDSIRNGNHLVSLYDRNLRISSKHLRTAFKDNQYLVLSPYYHNAGTAYLEFNFPFAVYEFNIALGLYSSNEGLDPSRSTVVLQYKDVTTGDWINFYDLLNPINNLSTNRHNLTWFYQRFPNQYVHDVRIHIVALKSSNADLGRLCARDIQIYP